MPKKKKQPAKKMKGCENNVCGETQHNVPKRVEEHKKVKPSEVFQSKPKAKPKNGKGKTGY
mgnify:CR=1 FL=1